VHAGRVSILQARRPNSGSPEDTPRLDAVESRGCAVSSADVLLLWHAACSGGQGSRGEWARRLFSLADLSKSFCSERLKQML